MKKKIIRFIVIFLLSGIAFFLTTMPFRQLFSVFTATEVRPAAVLNPFLGISFGLPAALGIAVANAISDYVSGYPFSVWFWGFFLQFAYSFVPYLLWRFFSRGLEHKHRLDSAKRVAQFVAVCLVYALLSGLGVGTIIHLNYGADLFQVGFFAGLNNLTMSIILGCPMMIAANQIISRIRHRDRTLSLDEKIILFTTAVELVILGVIIAFMYQIMPDAAVNDLWNHVFFAGVAAIITFTLFALGVMAMTEKERKGVSNTHS